MQEPFDGLDICQSWIDFLRQNMDGKYVRPAVPFADMTGMTAKNDHAVGCHTQNGRNFRISRALNKKAKIGSVPIKIIMQEFLLRGHPVIQIKAMQAATLLKNLVSASGDRRLDNLLMPFPAALDRYYPVVRTLSAALIHSSTLVPLSFLITHTRTVLFQGLKAPGSKLKQGRFVPNKLGALGFAAEDITGQQGNYPANSRWSCSSSAGAASETAQNSMLSFCQATH